MLPRVRPVVLAMLLLGCLAGCDDKETECRSARSCIDRYGMPGLCAQMRCAFFDDECVSEYRWDDSAGTLAGVCVDPLFVPDASVPDARIRDAGAADR